MSATSEVSDVADVADVTDVKSHELATCAMERAAPKNASERSTWTLR